MPSGSDSHPVPLLSQSQRLVTAPVTTDPETPLRAALGAAYDVRLLDRTTRRRTHLDTPDQRLREAGLSLTQLENGVLVGRRGNDVAVNQDAGPIDWPALATELPDGPVRDLVAGAASIRALLALATVETRSTTFAVLNSDHKTVARVGWTEGELVSPAARSLGIKVEVERLRGYAPEAKDVRRRLVAAGLDVADGEPWRDAVLTAANAGRPSGRRFGMHADQPGDLAVADALLGYLAELEASVQGVVDDVDTEYLHDFRVAVRRTRSVLKLLGDVLPAEHVGWAAAEFRWLGDITTPTRDLDVYLLGMDGMRAAVSRPDDLDPFGAYVRARRQEAQAELADALRSPRYATLTRRWRAALAEAITAPTNRPETAGDLARTRIEHTFTQVSRRAKAIKTSSPSAQVHALRKKCKELRYLMEVFRPLCDPVAYKRVIADFKELQETLGEFQDGEVQAAGLRDFAAAMMRTGETPVETLLAMGQLSAEFDARQQRARSELDAHHESYLGKKAARHLDTLLSPGVSA
ncbi:CYTH and CHAD domain-containing protein [Microlunatus ginsengisoli]|uniref:CYTH and CHAD domain-containing protein n=1 Tax=Microlunatus ginsengisoli TaxID=363863 RepID=UPI0031E1C9F2